MLLLLYLIWNILEIVNNNSVIHLVEVYGVVFSAPGLCIRECKSKLRNCEKCVWCQRHFIPVLLHRQ